MTQPGYQPVSSRQIRNAPGPRGKWVVGVLPEVRRDPLAFLLDTARRYGDVARFRVMANEAYLISHPEGVRHILQENHRNYSKQSFDYQMLKPLVGEGLLTADGEKWLKQRHLIQPAFHKERLQGFTKIMIEKTGEMVERWDCLADHKAPFNVAEEMTRLTLSIVGEALFGRDLSREAARVGQAFQVASEEIIQAFRSFNLTPGGPAARSKAFKEAVHTLNEVTLQIIHDHRKAQAEASPQGSSSENADLLSMLLDARDEQSGEGMSEAQLRDEVITLLLAGHETTANALSWTWYLLAKNPSVEKRLKNELARELKDTGPSGNGSPRLEYTRRVIQEALRLYPPAWLISRRAEADDQIGGFRIKKGSTVLVSPYVTHHHLSFWKDPARFNPDRFMPEEAESRPSYAYFPFGGGPRLCIGRDFALMEAQIILASLAKRYRLELAPGHTVEPEALITLRPEDGIWVIAHQHS